MRQIVCLHFEKKCHFCRVNDRREKCFSLLNHSRIKGIFLKKESITHHYVLFFLLVDMKQGPVWIRRPGQLRTFDSPRPAKSPSTSSCPGVLGRRRRRSPSVSIACTKRKRTAGGEATKEDEANRQRSKRRAVQI